MTSGSMSDMNAPIGVSSLPPDQTYAQYISLPQLQKAMRKVGFKSWTLRRRRQIFHLILQNMIDST